MIRLGSAGGSAFDTLPRTPKEAGGLVTQSAYIIVGNVDAHYRRASAAGAQIVMKPDDQPYGGRLYSRKDVEGHLWDLGSYNPWPNP